MNPASVGFVAATALGWAFTGVHVTSLRRRLRTDPLTGLGNRLALQRIARRSSRSPGRRVAVLLLDLNGFKPVNDTFGHCVGDRVLIEIGRRLRAYQGPGRLAVRLSGDEFAFWISNAPDDQTVEQLRHDLAAAIAEPLCVDDHPITITASIGTAATTDPLARVEDLLEPADKTMYREKHRYVGEQRRLRIDSRSRRRREEVA
ncbi:GGDEF domain-containing protein [Saccharopolyspora phatthalungensis]|uniref:Diguanylate cyclase (GGDEF)-like protein n=1 Tax=Saccharopolyspora phatthalungensis TaxID=664693 RepID=A0A840QG63_9PSEU|nr:GGDEF domain-containing protein [Saccharopolyspora phatthalungensis]MBB5158940.1 diguanylate cyclase (GGDEF)-like protein [Saccharopolyspora phatthalungensis]